MRVGEYIDALRREGELLAKAVVEADLTAAVPTCPDWTVRDLVRHIGGVHRWARGHVAEARLEMMDDAAESAAIGPMPEDGQLLDWFLDGHAALVHALATADADLQCWTFLAAPSPLAFWARRQAHETAIHRADAQSAGGATAGFPTDFAVDGIDELLTCFFTRPRGRLRSDQPRTLHVCAEDADRDWTVHIGPDRVTVELREERADCAIGGLASDLYLALWNRRTFDDLHRAGERAVLDLWRERATIRWS